MHLTIKNQKIEVSREEAIDIFQQLIELPVFTVKGTLSVDLASIGEVEMEVGLPFFPMDDGITFHS
jgi:hypothetical protein